MLTKKMVMALADEIITKMEAEKKITTGQYLESVADIQTTLNISEKEYADSLDCKWGLSDYELEMRDIN